MKFAKSLKHIRNMLPNCTSLYIMNKTMKWKQNAQSQIYDYDFFGPIKDKRCCQIQ